MNDKYKSLESKASYGVGLNMGNQLLNQPFEGLDVEAVSQGLKDAFAKVQPAVSHQDLDAAFKHINEVMQTQKAEQSKGAVSQGTEFLKNNAEKEGVVTTESGLQYQILTTGTGKKPSLTSTVKTHYHGTLIDGTVFDSSYDRGQPAEFPVNGVIKGWTEALQMMGVGSKWRLTVPYDLAYGEQGAGASIGPFSTLIFDVELQEIIA